MLDTSKLESWLCKLITILIFYYCITNFTNLAAWNSHDYLTVLEVRNLGMVWPCTAEIEVSASAGFSSGAQGPCPGSFHCQQHAVPCGVFEVLIFLLVVDWECSQHLETVIKSLLCGSSIGPPAVLSLFSERAQRRVHLIKAKPTHDNHLLIYSKSSV